MFALQHPFVQNVEKKPVLDLISESKAEVVETVEDLTEEEEVKEIKVHWVCVWWGVGVGYRAYTYVPFLPVCACTQYSEKIIILELTQVLNLQYEDLKL